MVNALFLTAKWKLVLITSLALVHIPVVNRNYSQIVRAARSEYRVVFVPDRLINATNGRVWVFHKKHLLYKFPVQRATHRTYLLMQNSNTVVSFNVAPHLESATAETDSVPHVLRFSLQRYTQGGLSDSLVAPMPFNRAWVLARGKYLEDKFQNLFTTDSCLCLLQQGPPVCVNVFTHSLAANIKPSTKDLIRVKFKPKRLKVKE
jgi:hypothetical protein